MAKKLFMFLALGVAGEITGFRPGARHALMIFVSATALESGRSSALAFVEQRGWSHTEITRGKEVGSDVELIGDDALRSAAECALESGGGIVVYSDELRPDS